MHSPNVFTPAVPLLILALALLIDLTIGEPPDKLHPTVWMGKVIALLKPKIKNSRNRKIERDLIGLIYRRALRVSCLFRASLGPTILWLGDIRYRSCHTAKNHVCDQMYGALHPPRRSITSLLLLFELSQLLSRFPLLFLRVLLRTLRTSRKE